MLKDSNTWPWLLAPSPYMANVAVFLPRYFCANRAIVATGSYGVFCCRATLKLS